MVLYCAPNILFTYISKIKTTQPNYPNRNHILAPNFKKKKEKKNIPIGF